MEPALKILGGTMRVRMNRMSKSGAVLICGAIILWVGWTSWDSNRTWFFGKDAPISLSKGSRYSSGVVRTNMDALYSIYILADFKPIDARYKPDTDKELVCRIGIGDPTVQTCKNPPEWSFRWVLTADRTRLEGDSSQTVGEGSLSSDGEISRKIGEFRSRAHHSYQLDVEALFDNRDSRIVRPRITVAVSDFHAESSLFLAGLLKVICLSVAGVGVALIVVPGIISVLSPKAQRT